MQYWLDFILAPLAVLLAWLFADSLGWYVAAAGGFAFWTFAEYWLHRIALHKLFWHGQHERHHLYPEEHVVFPLHYTAAGFAAYAAAVFAVGWVAPALTGALGGFMLGYCWFLVMHHLLHHCTLTKGTWLERYADWHMQHHLGHPANYGITTNIWDRLFKTYRKPPVSGA